MCLFFSFLNNSRNKVFEYFKLGVIRIWCSSHFKIQFVPQALSKKFKSWIKFQAKYICFKLLMRKSHILVTTFLNVSEKSLTASLEYLPFPTQFANLLSTGRQTLQRLSTPHLRKKMVKFGKKKHCKFWHYELGVTWFSDGIMVRVVTLSRQISKGTIGDELSRSRVTF